MQTAAFDQKGTLTSIFQAKGGMDYTCIECGSCLRPRNGPKVHPHFYHKQGKLGCRHLAKSPTHCAIQSYFLTQFFPEPILLEHPFPSIGRIADLYLPKRLIVFEIQCSPISQKEIQERTDDYQLLGIKVVWIFHTKSFFKSPLSHIPHYFTTLNEEGKGIIFDQWLLEDPFFCSPWYPIEITSITHRSTLLKKRGLHPLLANYLKNRQREWKITCAGDLFTVVEKNLSSLGNLLENLKSYKRRDFRNKSLMNALLFPYKIIFEEALERATRAQ